MSIAFDGSLPDDSLSIALDGLLPDDSMSIALDDSLPDDWTVADVIFTRTNETREIRTEMIHGNTRYLHESMCATAFKCFLISLALPVFTAAVMAFRIVRTLVVSIKTLSLSVLVKELALIALAPYYALRMEGWALYGMFVPLEAKIHLPEVEREWSSGSRRESINVAMGWKRAVDFFANEHSRVSFYLAACFQPYGRTDDDNVASVTPIVASGASPST